MMASNAVYGDRADGRVHAEVAAARHAASAGEVGFIIGGIKELQAAKVGDTITLEKKLPNNRRPGRRRPLPGFKEIQPQVFAGLYPTEASEYDQLRDALEKLKLNDSVAALRAGSQPGARLRLSLRLPRPAAHGDRARNASSASSTRT